ncbi:MAG: PilN domain-containing protein [Gammaproteobacteria bacterium]
MQSIKQDLRTWLSSPLGRGFSTFWDWWRAELATMLPAGIRHAVLPRVQRLLLELDESELVVSRGSAEAMHEVERYDLAHGDEASQNRPEGVSEIVLSLPQDKVLTKALTLPLAAEENLREVLAFEMSRQTPFRAEQVYYDYLLVTRDSRKATLSLELVLAPRRVLDELLATLDRFGFHPDVITTRDDSGQQFLAVNLLPEQYRQARPVMARRVNAALALLTVLLLIAAVSLPLWHKRQLITALEPEVQVAVAQAAEVRRLQEEVEQLQAGARFLAEMKQSRLLTLQILNEVTRILPDDTWVNRLEIKGSEVQLQGESTAVAALIPLIESSPLLQNARFRSPITQVARSNAERFHLSADVVEGAVP